MSPRLSSATGAEVVRALQKAGFVIVRISGSHQRLVYSESRAVTVPVHGAKALKRGTLQSILRQAGLTAEQLLELF
jgi:predicted RNA binding protein YcfA (HicA-like mRNA interferase family)